MNSPLGKVKADPGPLDPFTAPLMAPSLTRRMACWLYEGMLLFGVVFITGYLFSTLSQTRNAMDNRHGLQAFIFLIFGIYFTWFGAKGQTLAMKTWHIRVVDVRGQALSQQRALLRYFLAWMWFLPPIALAYAWGASALETLGMTLVWIAIWAWLSRFQGQKQYWHDIWAGTRLVHEAPKPPAPK